MRAFLNRLHLGGGEKGSKDKEKLSLPPLPQWPPPSLRQQLPPRSASATPVSVVNKPLPDGPRPQTPTDRSNTPTPAPETPTRDEYRSNTPHHEQESTRSSRKTTSGQTVNTTDALLQKKVAFISPPPTPAPAPMLDRVNSEAPSSASTTNLNAPSTTSSPAVKSTVSRFQATHQSKEPRGSTSTALSSSSKTDLGSTSKASNKQAPSTRTASPYMQKDVLSSQSLRSGTPYSQMTANTSSSRILAAASWSEVTEEDLVSNLGSRERTRQEVLFEIISSEERYVLELVKMKDTFIDPLLHPFSNTTSPLGSSANLEYDFFARSDSPLGSTDYLPPIAARFMSPTPPMSSPPPPSSHTPAIDGESLETDEEDEYEDRLGQTYTDRRMGNTSQASKHTHPRSPYRGSTAPRTHTHKSIPFPSRSHQSLPPPPRTMALSDSTHSLGRQSVTAERRERNHSQGQQSSVAERKATQQKQGTGVLRKFKKSQTSRDDVFGDSIAPRQLPDDLRICLEVIDSGVFEGHKRLHEALKKRYDEQYPLVRSLADVFVANSDLFTGYAKYVLHLERALEQVNELLTSDLKKAMKKPQDATEWSKVCKFVQKLEQDAFEKGETGLAITLSKPFQRLLKYPLLFQNLLYHTDPSTFEYESTLQMVAEVESIVRSIEDEKIQKEDRDKTRDVFARIEGLDKVRQLALPKPSRVLVEERPCPSAHTNGSPQIRTAASSSPPPVMNGKNVRGKSSFRRLSDVLSSGNSNGIGGKKDLWFVVFNDVVLQCQRTGTTSLPLSAATNSRTNSLPELQGKAKYATAGRRNQQTKPRNLYKFLKIETWAITDVLETREGVVSKEDVARSRMQVHQPRIVPLPDDDEDEGGDSDDSDRKSKMSFSYWGADKITVQKPVVKTRAPAPRRGGAASPSYNRESSANAKFGTRLVTSDATPSPRPASRRTQATPSTTRARHADDSTRATVTRPAWDATTRSTQTPTSRRPRQMSQTSTAVKATTVAAAASSSATLKSLASPAPSEDSGVGLYRQMLAQDPSLDNSRT